MNTLILLLALLACAAWIASTVTLRMKALDRRAERLERRLGLVLDHLGIEEPEPAGLEGVRALLREGRTIEAIKAYRSATGADLAEAKRSVEELAEALSRA
ncbi:hypothetical protein HYE82_13305 [Streptomyces sp. BR123]|uniref:hypothetical protein n=1 Tax=Streptomyces sp. BR123 TaxID=2749828 RepID=UPI0015C445F8|nr:hypothetical protein [Streptomyces sp. BR123]NXY95345.1 hypothetical protein [Streptomyces sp. BR123]